MLLLPYDGVWPRIAHDAFVAPTAVVVGDVTVGAGASIWFGAVVRGDLAPIQIGERTNIQDNCTIHCDPGLPCIIGTDCTIGHGAIVHGALLGDRVLVGMQATVLNGARIADDCIVAASALVPEGAQIRAAHLVMGVPGRVRRPITEAERSRILEGSAHYQAAARAYAAIVAAQAPAAEDMFS